MAAPDQAAHLLGKLLRYVGEDNVLWGTDSIFYGAPQDQIQTFRVFQISEEFQDRFGYPPLTDDLKRKILGLNALRLHDVDPTGMPDSADRDELEALRVDAGTMHATYGPRTRAASAAFRAAQRPIT